MADIFEEVEEGIRQDRLTKAWKKYGIFAYLAGGLLIGGVALNEYLQNARKEATIETTMQLETALSELDAGDYEVAGRDLETLAQSNAKPAQIAAHFLAQVRLDGNGDAAAAAETLTSAAGDASTPAGKLALMKSAYLQADTLTRAELETLLAPIRSDESTFGALAVELIAAKALEEGDVEYARSEFTYLRVAPDVPAGVATRASQAIASLPPTTDPLLSNDVIDAQPEADPAPVEEAGE